MLAALVRWLVAEAGASVEARDSRDNTPLLQALANNAGSAAHALLDCGARVDEPGTAAMGLWPVLAAAQLSDVDIASLRRLLAADRDSLLRRSEGGFSLIHLAAACNTVALSPLLDSGLPHIAEAINAVAVVHDAPSAPGKFTPLHVACGISSWDAALALLAAGARVDIAGHIDGKLQTIAAWARSSSACRHRGVKLAVAARTREHAAQAAAAAAKGLSSGGSGSVAGQAPAAAPATAASADGGSVCAAVGAAAGVATRVLAAATAAGPAGGRGKLPPKGRMGRRGAASNRVEEALLPGAAAEPLTPCVAAAGTTSSVSLAIDGSAGAPASAVAAAATASAALETCESLVAAGAPGGVVRACLITPQVGASSHPHLNLPEDPLAQAALLAVGAVSNALGSPEYRSPAADGLDGVCVPLGPAGHASACAAATCAPSTNTGEQGATTGAGSSRCEPGKAPEPNACEPGKAPEPNACEQGEGAASLVAAATAIPAHSKAAEGGTAAGTAGAALIAALQDGGVSAAAVRRHLAALSELARDPAAAAGLESQGAIAAVTVALSRHGAAVSRAAAACLAVLSVAGAEGSDAEEGEESEA